MTDIPGLPARRAALQLLDAVLRRGQALETALFAATKGIEKSEDRALAHAIASEVLRRMPDLDDLIDGATRQRLPDDAKARMVLRIALVQALILKTPEHAAVATALPLVDGGPRRLVLGLLAGTWLGLDLGQLFAAEPARCGFPNGRHWPVHPAAGLVTRS